MQLGGNVMLEVLVATSQWCVTCPATVRQWQDLAKTYDFSVREVDVGTLQGRELAVRLYIRSVPSTIVNNQVIHVGTIDRKTAVGFLEQYGAPKRT